MSTLRVQPLFKPMAAMRYTWDVTQRGTQSRGQGPHQGPWTRVQAVILTSCVRLGQVPFLTRPLASSSVKQETDELMAKEPLSSKFDSQENKRSELYKPHEDISE